MSTPYIGEIRTVGFNFTPVGYLPCDGRLVAISDFDILYTVIGTTYGGDGQTTFGLPDLQGRVPIHQGAGFTVGQSAGSEGVTLTAQQLPPHAHAAAAGGAATTSNPAGNLPGVTTGGDAVYAAAGGTPAPFSAQTVAASGGNQPHDNVMPFLAVNFVIAYNGVFPSPN